MCLRHDERGVSLLELAIFLPLILLIIAGVVDYGFALREIQVISSAAREGARIAATHARLHPVSCNDAKAPESGIRCDTASSTSLTIGAGDSVAIAAKKGACGFVRNSGLDPAEWVVKSKVPAPVTEDGAEFDIVTIDIRRSPDAPACLLCWESFLEALKPQSQSTFALEARCLR